MFLFDYVHRVKLHCSLLNLTPIVSYVKYHFVLHFISLFSEWSVADLHIEAIRRIDRAGGTAPGYSAFHASYYCICCTYEYLEYTLQRHCTENWKHIFPEMKLRTLVQNSYIHVSVSDRSAYFAAAK